MSRRWRVFHDPPIVVGDSLELGSDQAHHARSVLRLQADDEVLVFDGEGGEWMARIETLTKREVRVRVGEPAADASVDPSFSIELFQALCRQDRLEWLLQKGCELGLQGIHLYPAKRGEGPPLTRSRLDRWRRVLIESCKQSGRRRLPILGSIERLPDVPGGVIAFLADPRQAMPLIARLGQPRPDACWVAVGPESGLDDAELDDAVSRGWQPVSLGPRVLRTETAGLVATAVIQSCWGDLA